MQRLAQLTTVELAELTAVGDVVVLLPVGSVEPLGPHLPLATDTVISEAVAERAAKRLADDGITSVIAPAVAYGVTDYAAGFAGALSIPAATLSAFLRAVVEAHLSNGFAHVCLINNHLEPDHDKAVRAAIDGLGARRASVACPLTRRWGRTLSAEYKSGACHAGRYETSLMLAADADHVHVDQAKALPNLEVSLSHGIKEGLTTFAAMGLERAYTGAPAEATAEEGAELLDRLAVMVATEVTEALAG